MKPKDWLKINRNTFNDRDLRFLVKNAVGKDVAQLEKIEKLYIQGMPLAYILGKEEFFGYEFKISPKVLIPRPETELIVEKALEIINSQVFKSVLDLCCGCGNIAISIKKSVSKDLAVFASDCSFNALKIAKLNAKKHKANINFIQSDLLTSFATASFDLIVSNPPYVEDEAIKGSLKYEPRLALSGGGDGLEVIRRLLSEAKRCLREGGYLIVEIGYNHKHSVERIIETLGFYEIKQWIKDYSGNWRGVVLRSI